MDLIQQLSVSILKVHQEILFPLNELLEGESKNSAMCFFVEKIRRFSGFSNSIRNAPDGIEYGVGDPLSIKPFIDSVLTGKIKVWNDGGYESRGQRNKRLEKRIKAGKNVDWDNNNIIIGHFRTSFKGHIISQQDIEKIRNFFYGT